MVQIGGARREREPSSMLTIIVGHDAGWTSEHFGGSFWSRWACRSSGRASSSFLSSRRSLILRSQSRLRRRHLLAVPSLSSRGILVLTCICGVATVVGFVMTPRGAETSGFINSILSLVAIAATTSLSIASRVDRLATQLQQLAQGVEGHA